MLRVTNTDNLMGIVIHGDYIDLQCLNGTLHRINDFYYDNLKELYSLMKSMDDETDAISNMEQTKYDVFISYSRHDYVDDHENVIPNNEVSKIMEALTDAGITYWIDKEGIYSGDKFTEELPKIIKLAPIFVYLSTANANKSK